MEAASLFILVIAAILEVWGDGIIRSGFSTPIIKWRIILGFFVLGFYGVILNLLYHMNETKWDFSKLLGVYVAFFALISVLAGKFYYHEAVPVSTWIGLVVIISGGLIIQYKVFG